MDTGERAAAPDDSNLCTNGERLIRVLLVDDHAVVLQGLKMFLGLDPGITVVGEATNGPDAVLLASRLTPDVILMDLLMPGMSGVAAIQRIKHANPEIEIIALTSVLEDETAFKAIHVGASGYLLKNADANELANAIRRVYRGQMRLDPAATKYLTREAHTPPDSPEKLTERETQVLCLIAKGMSNKEIAAQLVVSEKTVKTHVSNVLAKLHLPSRTQAALYALREGLVLLDDMD
jgi:DNA-binding NarL/FixJ family response regulator